MDAQETQHLAAPETSKLITFWLFFGFNECIKKEILRSVPFTTKLSSWEREKIRFWAIKLMTFYADNLV